jgi:hypothetical protein
MELEKTHIEKDINYRGHDKSSFLKTRINYSFSVVKIT